MKYLVLGSQGQIGLSLCQYLQSEGHEVRGIDIMLGPEHDLRVPNNPRFFRDLDWCDFVMHLAWDVGGSVYLARYQDTFEFIRNNIQIAANTLDAIHQRSVPMIFASSQMANMSHSSYGITKSLAERMVSSMNAITVKFWNVYGIELDPQKTHVVTDFINKAHVKRCIDMRTDGTEVRQMLHADDCSRALLTLSQQYNDLPRDQNYHVTSFQWTSMLEIAEIVKSHFPGTTIQPARAKDTVQNDARNDPDPWILRYWQPRITIQDGISGIVQHIIKKE